MKTKTRKSGNKSKKLFSGIFSFLRRKQKIGFVVTLVILAVSAVLGQLTPLAIGKITDTILTARGIDFRTAAFTMIFILAVNIINELIKILRRLIVEDTATHIEKTARQKAATSLLKAPLSYFRAHMTGNIHGRLNRSLEGVSKLVKLVFMDFAPSLAAGIASIVVLFIKLPPIVAVVSVLVIPIGTAIVFRQIATQKGIRVELLDTKAEMDGTIVELLGGIETIRTLDSVDTESQRIQKRSEHLRKKEMKHHKAMAFYDVLKFTNEAIFTVVVIAFAVFLASRSIITVGTILTTYLCFVQLTNPLRELHRILDEFSECVILAKDYFSMLEIPLDFSYKIDGDNSGSNSDISDATDDNFSYNTQHKKIESGEIKIANLSFAYPEKEDCQILHDINMEIKSGSFVGIAGTSGSGKSSLIKILDKLEASQGEIFIGGKNIKTLSRRELAENISLVPQTPFIVRDTVKANISYGIKRSVTLEEIKAAATKAHIADDIENLPEKYDFVISEGGKNLSGGQRQRLALARVFLSRPRILILDEATSALDGETEKKVQSEIEKMQKENGTTIISIAHRISTLENCDELILIDGGKIAHRGKFSEVKKFL